MSFSATDGKGLAPPLEITLSAAATLCAGRMENWKIEYREEIKDGGGGDGEMPSGNVSRGWSS